MVWRLQIPEQALEGFKLLCRTEGIIPALESAHAIAHVLKLAPTMIDVTKVEPNRQS